MMAAGIHFSRIAKLLVVYYDLAHERTHGTADIPQP